MNKYILDTDIISYLEDASSVNHNAVKNGLSYLKNEDKVYISLLSLYEVEFGSAVAKSEKTKLLFSSVKKSITKNFLILPLVEEGANIFGQIKHGYMKKHGMTKEAIKRHNVDLMIASSAIIENATLVSNDKIFPKIKEIYPNLKLENWTK